MKLRHVVLSLTGAATAATLAGPVVPAFAATPPVTFTLAYYDSPGTDNRSAASLNQEYVRLTNNTAKPVNLSRWTVQDAQNHVYVFPASALAGKASVILHTGKGTDGKPAGHRFWGSGNYIWNNTGDTATLKDAQGRIVDTCGWKGDGASTYC